MPDPAPVTIATLPLDCIADSREAIRKADFTAEGAEGAERRQGEIEQSRFHPLLFSLCALRALCGESSLSYRFLRCLSKNAIIAFSAVSASFPLNPCPAPSSVSNSASTPVALSLSTSHTACSWATY